MVNHSEPYKNSCFFAPANIEDECGFTLEDILRQQDIGNWEKNILGRKIDVQMGRISVFSTFSFDSITIRTRGFHHI